MRRVRNPRLPNFCQREQVLGGDCRKMTMDSKGFGDQVVIKSFDPQFFKIMVSVYRKDVGMAIFAFKDQNLMTHVRGRSRHRVVIILLDHQKLARQLIQQMNWNLILVI